MEHIRKVTHVELVVEVLCSFTEFRLNLILGGNRGLDNWSNLLVDSSLKLGEVLVHEGAVDGGERTGFWEDDVCSPEVALQTVIDEE